MDDLVINFLIFAAVVIFSLLKHLRKGRVHEQQQDEAAPLTNEPARETAPGPERIDLSFLEDALASLGIEVPADPEPPAAPAGPEPEPAMPDPIASDPDPAATSDEDVEAFLAAAASREDPWHPLDAADHTERGRLFAEAIVLGAVFEPSGRR